jgi:hypothetical protein
MPTYNETASLRLRSQGTQKVSEDFLQEQDLDIQVGDDSSYPSKLYPTPVDEQWTEDALERFAHWLS